MKLNKVIATGGVALLLATALAACGSSTPAATDSAAAAPAAGACPWTPDESVTSTARIGYQNILNGDLIVKDLGLLEACMPNAKVSWSLFGSGGDVIQAFGAGSLDLGQFGSSPATKTLSAPLNLPLTVVWIHDVIGTIEALVVKDPAVKTIADLKGKTIGTPFASTSHYSLVQALIDAGIENDVTLINLEPSAMAAAWKDVDGVCVWDPALSELTKLGGTVILSNADTAKLGYPTFDLVSGTNDFLAANPAFMTQWAYAQNYAVSLILDNQAEAAKSGAAELALPIEDITKMFAGAEYIPAATQATDAYLGKKLGEDLFSAANFLLGQGSIDAVSAPEVYSNGVSAEWAKAAAEQ
jgi:taurine transport system substrate-binding protein